MKMIYKVCPPGYGKTKWLVNKAVESFSNCSNCLYVVSDKTSKQYEDFAEYYYAVTGHVCSIPPVNINSDKLYHGSVLFIDDLMKCEGVTKFIDDNKDNIDICYITMNGELDEGYTT